MNSGVKIDSQVLHFFKGVEVKSLEKKNSTVSGESILDL